MKKLTRLLSVLMLIAMCLSLMTVSASAAGIVTGDSAGSAAAEAPVVINNGGKDVYSTENYYKDSEFYSEEPAEVEKEEEEPVKGSESVVISDFRLNIQNEIDTSFPNVAENLNQILYVLNGYADGSILGNSPAMNDLKALFGDAVAKAIEAIDIVKNANRYAETYAKTIERNGTEKTHDELVNEFLADPVNIYRNTPLMQLVNASAPYGAFISFVVNGKTFDKNKGLDAAIKEGVASGKPIEVNGTWTFDTGVYSINFQGCTFEQKSAGIAAFEVNGSTYSFSNGNINGDGFVLGGGRVNLKNININVKVKNGNSTVEGNSAITVNGATVNVDGCNLTNGKDNTVAISSGAVTLNANVSTSSGPAIALASGMLNINGGNITGTTGIYIDSGTLNYNSDGSLVGTGAKNVGIGAAIASIGDNAEINIISAPANSISSAHNGAIVATKANNAERITTAPRQYSGTIHVADPSCLVNADDSKLWSDYAGAVAAIGNKTYVSLGAAVSEANDGDTIKLLKDCPIDSKITVEKGITIDGDGYTVSVDSSVSGSAIVLKQPADKTSQLKNITINCNGNDVDAVKINSAANFIINGLTVENCKKAGILSSANGTTTVSGYENKSTIAGSVGFKCDDGKIIVHSCVVDCPTPLAGSSNNGISIDGGSFKFDSAADTVKKALIDDHLVKGASAEQEGSYYTVTQDAASISLISGYDSSADPAYFWYFKGLGDDNAAMQFKSVDAVKLNQATVIRPDGTTDAVTIYLNGDTYTIEPSSVNALAAGSYTLRIPFVKGNYCDVGLKVYANAQVYCYKAGTGTSEADQNWENKDEKLPLYDVSQKREGSLWFSDKPVKVGITYNPADTSTITWLDDIYFNSDNTFTLMQDDLNKLPAGLNYVVLKYDDDCIFGAKVYVKNVNASINPEKVKWSTLYGDIVYTVVPDIKSVKFDGIELEKDNQYFINKSGKLVLKANFLKNYIAHDKDGNTVSSEHTLLVETSKGNVLSNITIGEQLKNNGVNYHIYGGTATLSFVGSNPIDYSKGIWIGAKNPVQIPEDYITQTSGTTFSIKADYLNKLTYGTYTIGAYINGEYCTTTFVICTKEAATAAATGDTFNAWIWIAILVLVAIIFFVILLPKLKGKKIAEPVEDEKAPEEDTKGKQ